MWQNWARTSDFLWLPVKRIVGMAASIRAVADGNRRHVIWQDWARAGDFLWLPVKRLAGFVATSIRAVAAGLKYRPLAVTAKDTLEWWATLPEERRASPRTGLAAEKEARVLAAWHARQAEG